MSNALEIEIGDVWEFRKDNDYLFAIEGETLEDPTDKVDMMWSKTRPQGGVYPMKKEQFSEPGKESQLIRHEDGRSIKEPLVRKWVKGSNATIDVHDARGCKQPIIERDGLIYLGTKTSKNVTITLLVAAATAGQGLWVKICADTLTALSLRKLVDKAPEPSAVRPDQWMNVELINPDDEPARFECEHCGQIVKMPDWVEFSVDSDEVNLG